MVIAAAVRVLVVSAAILILPPPAFAGARSHPYQSERSWLYFSGGMGVFVPAFDTDDGIGPNVSGDLRLAYHFSRRSPFGLIAGLSGGKLQGHSKVATIDLFGTMTTGDRRFDREFGFLHAGLEWTGYSPDAMRLRPRIAVSVGPVWVRTTHMFHEPGHEDGMRNIYESTDAGVAVALSLGLQYNLSDKPWGIGFDVAIQHAWDLDIYLPEGTREDNTLTIGITACLWRPVF